jgi:hypothetical protein
MKAVILFVACFVFCITKPSWAQITYPDQSYESTVREKVAFTTLTIRYGRPMQRGRKIFGGLVPFDQRWRTGAGRTTLITFDTPVMVGTTNVPAGIYSIVTIPGAKSWRVILHRDTTMFTQRKDYLSSDEVVNLEVTPQKSSKHFEAFTIYTDVVEHDAVVNLAWGNTLVAFTIKTNALDNVVGSIRSAMKNGELKTADDLRDAADFLGFNLTYLPPSAKDSAVMLIDKSIALDDQHKDWSYHVKRNIYLMAKDWTNYEKTSKELIAYLRQHSGPNTAEDIANFEKEMIRHKAMIQK